MRKTLLLQLVLAGMLVAIAPYRTDAQHSPRKSVPGPRGGAVAGFGQQQAVAKVCAEIRDALSLRKTLVVWLMEESSAAGTLTEKIGEELGPAMTELFTANPDRLETAVIGFGNEVRLVTPQPVHEAALLERAMREIRQNGSEPPDVFAAVQHAIEKLLPYRDQDYEVILVVIGASSSEDHTLADKVISTLKRKATAVFGIGPAVPFGAPNAGGRRGQVATLAAEANRSSAESFSPERIQLEIADHRATSDLDDSGYGPFSLERLCRQTGGKFFRLHDSSPAGWEVDERTGDIKSELLRKYAPNYVGADQYQRLLAENKCRMALHNASMLPPAIGLKVDQPSFRKEKDEAALAKAVTKAQEAAAIRDQPIQKLYDALIVGEPDRAKLTGARWQAGYDLAMGQVLAAKARLDGYNAMLATLKQGKRFTNSESTRWVLEPADDIPVGSALDKMAKNSRVYLRRVVEEHKGTPWAAIAERELRIPAGWKFVEK